MCSPTPPPRTPGRRAGQAATAGSSSSDERGRAMALSSDEQALFDALRDELAAVAPALDTLDAYYDGQQRLEQLGLAIPPNLMRFTVVVNWPRVVVDAVADRL